jgi:two-component system, chemotaxis family, CheB/CheR fusion protein
MSNTVLRNDVRDLLGIFEITQAKLFTPVSLEHRACAKRLQANPQERLFTLPSEGVRGMMSRRDRQGLLLENAFESGIAAQVLVNDKSQVAQFNQKARELFGLTSDNQGQNLSDMGFYFRPVELQPLIQRAYSQGHDVAVENVP